MMRWAIAILLPVVGLAWPAHTRGEQPYFPTGTWATVSPNDSGWNPQQLDAALDFALTRKSSAVVIVYRGRILAERYQAVKSPSARYRRMLHGDDERGGKIEDVASVQKSVVSFLFGVAQQKQLVKLDDPVHKHLGAGWSKATPQQEAAIRLRHLLTMTSGLTDQLEFAAEPGTKWRYNTAAYSRSLTAIAKAAGKSENDLTAEWLTKPVGMTQSRWVKRPGAALLGGAANRWGFATSARDLARFGYLVMNQGEWGQQKLLADKAYWQAALSSSQKLNPSYGLLWWLNGHKRAGPRRGPLLPTAPNDLVAALGALGRKCYVVPSLNLVVTRLGDNPDQAGQPRFDREFWRLLTKAGPKSP